MRLDDIPLLSMLKGRMGYLTQRQKVIAENVANADTVGYAARDLKPQSFDRMVGAARGATGAAAGATTLARTNAAHIGNTAAPASPYKAVKAPDSETRLDGNSVVLEEQMLKMAESRMAYDAAIGFYQKSMNLLRMAARAPGR